MHGQRNRDQFMNEQHIPARKKVSHDYLVEAALDREWEEKYRNKKFHKRGGHLPEAHSRFSQTNETGISIEEEGRP
jgi:hypothetical protein